MATRSTIVVEIPQEKIGTSYTYPKVKGEFPTPSVTVPECSAYVEVYHHWDGYPECLGKSLIDPENGLNNFDTIMEKIISGGDMSSIGTPYHAWRNEDWESVQPKFTQNCPKISEEYQYLFTLNGEWMVRDEYDIKEWTKVEDVLNQNETI